MGKLKKIKGNNQKLSIREKGITLVALVITTIILLILAGVTLTTALGENGLFQRAKLAAEKYQEAEKQEQESLKEAEKQLDELTKKTKIDVEDIGKKVDYEVDLDGDPKTYDWKLFYQGTDKDGLANGRIYIIAADYVPVLNELLEEATNENNANMTLVTEENYQNFCKNWSETVPDALQKMEDKNLFMTSMYNLDDKTADNAKCVSTLLNTENWSGFASGKYGDKSIGGPTLEMWLAAWNKLMPEDGNTNKDGYVKITPTVIDTEYGYRLSSESDKDKLYLYMDGTQISLSSSGKLDKLSSEGKYNVFFPNTNDSVTIGEVSGNCNGYWLASPSASDTFSLVCVNFFGNLNANGWSNYHLGLRPIVLLKSGVQLIWDDTDQVYKLN